MRLALAPEYTGPFIRTVRSWYDRPVVSQRSTTLTVWGWSKVASIVRVPVGPVKCSVFVVAAEQDRTGRLANGERHRRRIVRGDAPLDESSAREVDDEFDGVDFERGFGGEGGRVMHPRGVLHGFEVDGSMSAVGEFEGEGPGECVTAAPGFAATSLQGDALAGGENGYDIGRDRHVLGVGEERSEAAIYIVGGSFDCQGGRAEKGHSKAWQ